MLPKSFDIIGNIAILKFKDKKTKAQKQKIAQNLIKKHKTITTVLEKSDKVRGRLRTIKTKYLAGEKTTLATYKENNCIFKLDVEKTYFSPRLSNERKEIAQQVKKNEKVLVMFAGVAPYSIVIAKLAKPKIVYSNEINKIASKYAEQNVRINRTFNVEIIQGDIKRITPKLKTKFNRIVMPRPQLKDTFLPQAFKLIKKAGTINYYGFGKDYEIILNQINEQAKKAKKKIKILKIKKAGDIAPYKYRWRVDLRVVN